MIIEPPGTSLLNFSCGTAVLETAQNGSDGSIIGWIQGVENGFWQFIRNGKSIEVICHLGRWGIVVDTVSPCIFASFNLVLQSSHTSSAVFPFKAP